MLKRYLPHAAVILVVSIAVVAMLTYSPKKQPAGFYDDYYDIDPKEIQFKDDAQSQSHPEESLTELPFVDVNGRQVQLKDYVGSKNVVLVITRGFTSSICLYCSTQTSRLIANYDEFAKRNAEVVVVYPIRQDTERGHLDEFLAATKKNMDRPPDKVPFPVLLDVELKAVDKLGIRHDLSKPATFILDKEGQVRFSYVGKDLTDRPSVKALLNQLDTIEKGTK